MSNPTKRVTDALNILKLQVDGEYKKRDIDVAYRQLARTLHPDKGGTQEQFLALSEAYQIALGWIEASRKADEATVGVSSSAVEALTTLYTTMSTVRDKLNTYGTSANIAQNQLRKIFNDILYTLREDILDKPPQVACEILRSHANKFHSRINNVHSGPTPVFAAMVAGAVITIGLGIVALMITLFPPAGGVLGTLSLSGLVAIPPVGGLLLGTCCFFAATKADKNRSEQQQEMKKIVTDINALADAVQQNTEEDNSLTPSLI